MKKIETQLTGLAGPFTKIAAAMSRNWRVNIVPSGTRCATDGDTIWIPFTADYLGEDKRAVLHGLLDHEVAHVCEERVHAESGRRQPMAIARAIASDSVLALLFNVFEDIRIENKYARQYPGVAENLDAANRHSVGLFQERHGKGGMANFWNAIACAIIMAARGYDISWLDSKFRPYLALVASEIESARFLTWAEDSLDLAERVRAKLKDAAEEAKREREERKKREDEKRERAAGAGEGEESSGGDSEDTEGGEESDGEGSEDGGEDEGEAKGGEPSGESKEGKEKSGSTKRGKGEPSTDPGKGKSEAADEADEPSELEDAADDVLSDRPTTKDIIDRSKAEMERDVVRDAEKHHRYIPNPAALKADKWFKAPAGAKANYDTARNEVAAQISALRGKQVSYLQSLARRRVIPEVERGDVDPTSLAFVRTGRRNVFTDVSKKVALNTAIEVLIDLSGSMGFGDDPKHPAYYAKRTAIALAETWNALNIPFEVIGFYNNEDRPVPHVVGCANRSPFDFHIFKGWDERLAQTRARFATIQGYHNNADGEAVWAAALRLVQRPEARKILVVVSDGAPATYGVDPDVLDQHLRDVVKRIASSGIEVFGIGAGTDAPRRYYNKATGASHIIINKLDEMAVKVFKEMRDRVQKGVAA